MSVLCEFRGDVSPARKRNLSGGASQYVKAVNDKAKNGHLLKKKVVLVLLTVAFCRVVINERLISLIYREVHDLSYKEFGVFKYIIK